jgi:hypothetical protein
MLFYQSMVQIRYNNFYETNTGMLPSHNVRFIEPENIPQHEIAAIRLDKNFFKEENKNDHKYGKKTLKHIIKIIAYHKPQVIILNTNARFKSHEYHCAKLDQNEIFSNFLCELNDLQYYIKLKHPNTKPIVPDGFLLSRKNIVSDFFLINNVVRKLTKREMMRVIGYPESYDIDRAYTVPDVAHTEFDYVLFILRALVKEIGEAIVCPQQEHAIANEKTT